MKLRITAVALTLTLALAGQAAFAFDTCVTGCWTYEPCDGYCVDTGVLEPCGDLWAIIQECRPYEPPAQVLLQEVFSKPATAGDVNSGRGATGDVEASGVIPRPEEKAGGPAPSWCTSRNSSFCTYSWNWMTRCCNPSFTAPGAFCPAICE